MKSVWWYLRKGLSIFEPMTPRGRVFCSIRNGNGNPYRMHALVQQLINLRLISNPFDNSIPLVRSSIRFFSRRPRPYKAWSFTVSPTKDTNGLATATRSHVASYTSSANRRLTFLLRRSCSVPSLVSDFKNTSRYFLLIRRS